MSIERTGAFTAKGNPLTLVGAALRVGDRAPGFKVLAGDSSEVNLATDRGKVRLILSIPSLDTSVCDAEAKRFNEEANDFPDDVVVYAISCDLPPAQKRWCGTANIENVKTLSDHRELSFGQAYGTHVKELRLLSRAVFLVDKNDTLQYVEYVPAIGEHPNYEAVLETIKKVVS